MSITRLPSGRWRAQVWRDGRNVSVGTFDTKGEAKRARENARHAPARTGVTVMDWWRLWTTDKLYQRPKESTNRHNRERTRHFANAHADLPLAAVDDLVVARWLAGGKRSGQVPALRAMLNDAKSAKAGRLIDRNPFAGLGISRGKGNADVPPPPETLVWELVGHARELTAPSFAAWLQVAAFTGLRPGELDALRWDAVDLDGGLVHVREQVNAGAGNQITLPKNGKARHAPLTPAAREALVALAREGEWCFTTIRGTHYTASARAYHWKAVRAAAGYTGTLYLATRHFAGWYMTNVLELPSEDVAIALGHEDGGELVRRLYGHRDKALALRRVREAYEQHGRAVPLRVVRKDSA